MLLISPFDAGAESNAEISGDIIRILMPAGTLSLTFSKDDDPGKVQFLKSFLSSSAVTYGLKNLVEKERPNGESKSFPSGHATMTFSSAAFVHERYGFKSGLPMYALATYVGWTRIQSDNHDFFDVAAGAAIGTVSAFCFTEPFKETFEITPVLSGRKIGFVCCMKL